MKFIRSEALPEFEYFKEKQEKDTIVLHHTVSSVGKYVDDWFKKDRGKSKVAVAYVVDKDGTVFELFNPKYWAYHTGTGNRNNIDKRSIAIEIVNEGTLDKIGDKFYWFDGKHEYHGNPMKLNRSWRNHLYFAEYTEAQIKAAIELIFHLFKDFPGIGKSFSNTFSFSESFFYTNGIIMHCNIRTDKTDLSPAFPLNTVNNVIRALKNNYSFDDIKNKGLDML